MTTFFRMMFFAILIVPFVAEQDVAGEFMFKPENLVDNMAAGLGMENRRLSVLALPLCAVEMERVRVGSPEDEVEYSPSHYKLVRCKDPLDDPGTSNQVCSLPIDRRFPPTGEWGSTTCMQIWDTISIFWRPLGKGEGWMKYEDREIPSGCECMIMAPEVVHVDQRDVVRDDSQPEPHTVMESMQRLTKNTRYGRNIVQKLKDGF